MPTISVIIPVYNHADELKLCLASLREQNLKNFEIIVIDDASKDLEAAKEVVEQCNPPIQFIRFKKNRGAPHARNEGFRISKGELVIFLDADAVLESDALSIMVKTLASNQDIGFVYPSFYWGQKLFKGKPFDLETLKEENYIHTSALIRREAFPGFDETLTKFQDWDLFLRLAHSGQKGAWISQALYRIKPRCNGMSKWLPSFVQHLPWELIGWMPKTVREYREAKRIVQEKNGISVAYQGAFWALFRSAFMGVLLIELLSFLVIFHPGINSAFALLIGAFMLIIAWKNPALALSFLAVELVIGSKGALFKWGGNAVNDGGISLRMILFAAFFLAWGLRVLLDKAYRHWSGFLKGRKMYLALAALLASAFVRGLVQGSSFVFADANAWGFLLLLLPTLDLVQRKSQELQRFLPPLVLVALFYVSLKTIGLFYFFSHDFGALWEPVYFWVRRTGVGEVTRMSEASSAFRVFFQSHIYEVLAFVSFVWAGMVGRLKASWAKISLMLCTAVILISFSRSFWLGAFAGSIGAFFFFLRTENKTPSRFIQIKNLIRNTGIPIVLGLFLVAGALFFPLPHSTGGSLAALLRSRADLGEDAAVSRWSLLPVMWERIKEAPILGQGFGATVTYKSSDPRIVTATGGMYTTYSFEWGWMDFWLKFGVLGIPIMLWILFSIGGRLRRVADPWIGRMGIILLITLAVTHFFTPYLNHPLGFGLLIAGEGLMEFFGIRKADSERVG